MKSLRRTALLRTFLAALGLLFTQAAFGEVVRAVIDGPIHPVTAEYIARAVDLARQDHAAALVIELRTPGGLATSMLEIIGSIENSPVPVIAYVAPSGSGAGSAGFFILESADVAAMAPGTNTGAAHPVLGDGRPMDPVMKEKVENYFASSMRSSVSKRGRNVEVAESAVRQSKSFTDQEALDQHLIDYISPSLEDLFKTLENKTIVRIDGSKTTLHLAGQTVRTLDMTLKQRILSALLDPNLAMMILLIGALLIYAEFNYPGTIVPGAVGTVLVLLALFALNLLPLNYIAVALIVSALVLFVLEAKFASHGLLALAGVVALVFGSLLLVDAPIPEMRVRLSTAVTLSVVFGGITTFLTTLAIRARRNKSVIGSQALIGTDGVAQTQLSPKGKIFINGELWDAFCEEGAQPGDSVRVVAMKDFLLLVENRTLRARQAGAHTAETRSEQMVYNPPEADSGSPTTK